MKTCFKCGKELEDDEKFCDKCGARYVLTGDEIMDEAATVAINRRKGIIICCIGFLIILIIGILGDIRHNRLTKRAPYEDLMDSYVSLLNYEKDVDTFYNLYSVDAVSDYYDNYYNILIEGSDFQKEYDKSIDSKMMAAAKHFDEEWNKSRVVAYEILSADSLSKEELCVWNQWLDDQKERIENSFSYYNDVYKKLKLTGQNRAECKESIELCQKTLVEALENKEISEGYVLFVKFYNADNPNECERLTVNVLKIDDEYVFASKDAGMAELLISSTVNIY